MVAKLLDGTELAESIKASLKDEIESLKSKGVSPKLVALHVGENPGSMVYMRMQKKNCEEMGIAYEMKGLNENATEEDAFKALDELNSDSSVTGIIIQMPIPPHIDNKKLRNKLNPAKDVEGIHPENIGHLVYGTQKVGPCTAIGAVELLRTIKPSFKHLNVVVVGHSEIVGKPLNLLLLQSLNESATPTVCHIATKDLASHTKNADVVFVAVGVPGLIKGEMLKPGSIVIDIGINRIKALDENGNPVLNKKGKPKNKIVGDVAFEEAMEVCEYLTPVPGGVGPLTVAMLLKNTVECAKMACC